MTSEPPVNAGATLGGGGDQGGPAEEQGESSVQIPAANLPSGIKAGDCLRCTAVDENGGTFELEAGDDSQNGPDWESDFRKEMSPASPTQGPM